MLKNSWIWRQIRNVKRSLIRTRLNAPLSASQVAGKLQIVRMPLAVEVDIPFAITLEISNHGNRPWTHREANAVRLVATWQTRNNEPFGKPEYFDLPSTVFPGESLTLDLSIPAPGFVGDFHLTIDLEQSAGSLFSTLSSAFQPAIVTALPVHGQRIRDIDYHEVYATANLEQNHWWVVGKYDSRDDYERSIQGRFEMLRTLGLQPTGRVLDIGCGTGQIAEALSTYLAESGAYFGCDIGREAIQFCEQRYRRPNFVFRPCEMTSVPFSAEQDGTFDFVLFFSVFTHTFTDESALLLGEAVRLLAPDGIIVADIIASHLVERCAGNRGEMVVNRDHFLRLAMLAGLSHEIIGQWTWNAHTERLMIRFRRRSHELLK